MRFYISTKLYSETGCVRKHSDELAAFGKRAMIVTGRRSSRVNGSLSDVEAALNTAGISYVIFDEVEENPSIETVMKARNLGVLEQVEFVIGVGGGSPLDAAKAIALMIANPDKTEEALYELDGLNCIPVVCVPTTCGTGSEVTPYAVLTIHKQRTKKSIKQKVFPDLALLDSTYLRSMSRTNLVHTAVDALAHLIESYLNTNTNEWNRAYSREGMRIWAQFKVHLKDDRLQEEDYEKMLRASAFAGMAIAHTGTSLPHGLSYSVTYEEGYSHGKAVGMFLAGYLSLYKNQEDVNEVLSLLGFESVSAFAEYMHELLGPTDVDKKVLYTTVQMMLKDTGKLKNYPYEITEQELLNMVGGCV